MEYNSSSAIGHVPVVSLMKVIVKSHHRPSLAISSVALDHLSTLREPFAAVRLNEVAPFVTVDRRVDDVHAGDRVRLIHFSHGALPR
jgi:hypothetical protein